MASKQLEASVRRRNGVALIDLDGEINAMAEEALNTAYQEAAGESPKPEYLASEIVPRVAGF